MATISRYSLIRGWKSSCGSGRISRGRQEYCLSLETSLSPRRTAWHRRTCYPWAATSITGRTAGHPLALLGTRGSRAWLCHRPVDTTASGVSHPQTVRGFLLRLSCQPYSCCLGLGHAQTFTSCPPDGTLRVSVLIDFHALAAVNSERKMSPRARGMHIQAQFKSFPSRGRNSGHRRLHMPGAGQRHPHTPCQSD